MLGLISLLTEGHKGIFWTYMLEKSQISGSISKVNDQKVSTVAHPEIFLQRD